MRYIKFELSIGLCRCNEERYIAFSDDTTEKPITEYGIELAEDHADSYRNYERFGLMSDRDEYDSEEEYDTAYQEAEETFNEGIESSWEEVDEEEWEENDGEEA
jgi:hypothetical protein